MATIRIENEPRLAWHARAMLSALRGWIRLYAWVEGLAVTVAWLGVAFWGSLLIDWFFEPPAAVRVAMWFVVVVGFCGVLVRWIGRRAFARFSDAQMATLLERQFPQLDDSLLTAVTLTARATDPAHCNRDMLDRTCRQAARRIKRVELHRVFNLGPLLRSVAAGALLIGTVAAFVGLFPGASRVWAARMLLLSNDLWPRQTRLLVDGFENGSRKVARGADLEIVAKADTTKPWVPQAVEVRYRTEGGAGRRATMKRLAPATPGRDPFQEYSYTFASVLAPIRFDVIGGDDRLRDLQIEVVDSPTVDEMQLDCRFPEYTNRTPRTFPISGVMQIPAGTEVTVRATANKDLLRVQVDSLAGEEPLPQTVFEAEDLAADPRRFRHTLNHLDDDTTLLFTLLDTDEIHSRQPVRLSLVAVADTPPLLAVRLKGIGSAITPEARLPAAGRVTDDYGIAEVWFDYVVDQSPPARNQVDCPATDPTDLKLEAALEVRDLKLTAGQKLLAGLKASDRCTLGEGANVGASERWLLDVVTPEQLRAQLDARELVLRQRFESTIQEVTETRNLLLRTEFGPPAEETNTEDAGDTAADEADAPAGDKLGNEPGDRLAEGLSPERRLALRTLRVQWAVQNSRKNAHETEGMAEAFDDIRLQLINNRIDTEELIARIEQGIAAPLQQIATEMFPELERRLESLQAEVADERVGPEKLDLALQQVDAILRAMQQVLGRMIELEDFNEAVDLLRAIIQMQEELGEQTKQRQKQRILELLED